MTEMDGREIAGTSGRLFVRRWDKPESRYIALLAHGYGEHVGRYEYVAERLVAHGAVVYGPDHAGHGRSEGEHALVPPGEVLTADLHLVCGLAREEHPDLPVVLIGHSMGGLVATRFTQKHGAELIALVLSGPVVGGSPDLEALLTMDPIPDVPIDPAVLSRDPAVGAAYAADPLVWHGPFKRGTLEQLFAGMDAAAQGPDFGMLPTLWIHGEEDALVPLGPAREAMEHLRGPATEQKTYPGARHEIFNETNRDEVIADVLAFLDRVLPPREPG